MADDVGELVAVIVLTASPLVTCSVREGEALDITGTAGALTTTVSVPGELVPMWFVAVTVIATVPAEVMSDAALEVVLTAPRELIEKSLVKAPSPLTPVIAHEVGLLVALLVFTGPAVSGEVSDVTAFIMTGT